jgi:hypothetical protein
LKQLRLIHVSVGPLESGTLLKGYRVADDPSWIELNAVCMDASNLTKSLLSRWYANHVLVATLITEAIYETVRLAEFPDKPTRLGASFACASPEAAMYFALRHRTYVNPRFFEVQSEERWVADMKRLDPSIELSQYPIEAALGDIRQRAQSYWGTMAKDVDVDFELPEVLMPTRAAVVRELTPPFMR